MTPFRFKAPCNEASPKETPKELLQDSDLNPHPSNVTPDEIQPQSKVYHYHEAPGSSVEAIREMFRSKAA